MDIVPVSTYLENFKRFWRRRRYQRLDEHNRKRIKITRLGNKSTRPVWKLRLAPKLRFKVVSPIKLVTKFHKAYVDLMLHIVRENKVSLFGKKELPKGKSPVPVVSGSSNEIVDERLVMEIYKRLVSSRELTDLLL